MEDNEAKAENLGTVSLETGESQEAKSPPRESPKKKSKAIIEGLKKNLEEQRQLAQNHYEKFLRACAELENYKKRVEREKADGLKYANEGLIGDLLPFIDNLERAVEHGSSEKNDNTTALIEGLKLTLKDLIRVLGNYGLAPIESVGRPFDPNLHEAMMQVEREDHEPRTIVQEFQKGYRIKDRLLRPARVSVAMGPESREGERAEEEA